MAQQTERAAERYLAEAADGTLVSVPEEKLAAWQAAQRAAGSGPLNREEQQLRDAILDRLFGKAGS